MNRNNTFYNAYDVRSYVNPEDFGLILDYANAKYNGKGWQEYGQFGPKQISRQWGNIIKNDEIFVKASVLAVGADKPQRGTQGWQKYGGSIPKIGHGRSIDEADLLTAMEIRGLNAGQIGDLMIENLIATSEKIIGGIHNTLTAWTYEALSTGFIHEASIDGSKFDLNLKVPANHLCTPTLGKSWFTGETANTDADPVQDLLDCQKVADDTNMPYDHWEMSKALWRKFTTHPSVMAKCRNHMTNNVNANYTLVEGEIKNILSRIGVAPIKVVSEKSSIEEDGIAKIDAPSFNENACVLCSVGDIFEVKNAISVYEERMKYPMQTAMYGMTADRIVVMDQWFESPIKNVFDGELWAVPVIKNPNHLLIFNCENGHTFE